MADIAKVITVIGSSPESFAKAAEGAGQVTVEPALGDRLAAPWPRLLQQHPAPDPGGGAVQRLVEGP